MPEPNYMINAVLSWLKARPFVLVIVFMIFVGLVIYGVDSYRARRFDKQRAEFEQQSRAWTTEKAGLIASAEAKEKRIAELEPKAIAFDALAEQNKRIDAGLAQQIEEVSKNAGEEEARAEVPTDCRVRALRVCVLLRANNIKHDCTAIARETCGAGQ